jgi:hypothetical protein
VQIRAAVDRAQTCDWQRDGRPGSDFLQPLLRHTVITDTLDDPRAFADSRGQAEQVVNLFGTQEGAARQAKQQWRWINDAGSSADDFGGASTRS